MKQISLRLDDELFEAIDKHRGQTPRETWVRELVIAAVALPDGPVPNAYGLPVDDALVSRATPQTLSLPSQDSSAVAAAVLGHRPTCRCPVCRPPKGGG